MEFDSDFFGDISWYQESKEPGKPQESDFLKKKNCESSALLQSFYNFLLQWKSDKSTKHYFTLMLLPINWRYWQMVRNSCKHMKVQGHLMKVRFIEIHQVFKKTLDFCNWLADDSRWDNVINIMLHQVY